MNLAMRHKPNGRQIGSSSGKTRWTPSVVAATASAIKPMQRPYLTISQTTTPWFEISLKLRLVSVSPWAFKTGNNWAGSFFVLYIILGHKISEGGASGGVEMLGAAMTVAFLFVMPIGFLQALEAFGSPFLVLAGVGVGICSSVIPYVNDQLAMSRLPRSSYAFLLALLPATATIIGVIVLRQILTAVDVLGVVLVMVGVAVHKPPKA